MTLHFGGLCGLSISTTLKIIILIIVIEKFQFKNIASRITMF